VDVRQVVVSDDVWIGNNATILKGVHIGAGAIVQPGAVVTRDVSAGVTVAGNPARELISEGDDAQKRSTRERDSPKERKTRPRNRK
jgi:acetyltransferase-like isoleucine patch superfamily enzyme